MNPPLPMIDNEDESFEEEPIDLQGGGVGIFIPSTITDLRTRLDTLLGLKQSGHTDTKTEASNLIDEIHKRSEIQTELHYREAFDKFKNS